MTHLLDTSAFLAYYFGEPGGEKVRDLFEDEGASIVLSAATASEFWARLRAVGQDEAFEREWELHRPLFDAVLPMDEAVALRAIAIRRGTAKRVPTIDALIAATAAVHNLVLVHRDPHFCAIPESELQQLEL